MNGCPWDCFAAWQTIRYGREISGIKVFNDIDMVTGVFGGSFNPVHNGHIALARAVVAHGMADRVLMVLSPLNPLKENPEALIDDSRRMDMLRIACAPYPELVPSDIEMSMPRPSYSVNTLGRLSELHPGDTFRLVIGADNWACFHSWYRWQEILADYPPIVYPRQGYDMPDEDSPVTPLRAPLYPVSSSGIREKLIKGEPAEGLLPAGVLEYIRENGLYGKNDPRVEFKL